VHWGYVVDKTNRKKHGFLHNFNGDLGKGGKQDERLKGSAKYFKNPEVMLTRREEGSGGVDVFVYFGGQTRCFAARRGEGGRRRKTGNKKSFNHKNEKIVKRRRKEDDCTGKKRGVKKKKKGGGGWEVNYPRKIMGAEKRGCHR